MSTKAKVLLGLMLILGAFAFGRFSAPTKVVTDTKTVEVDKKAEHQVTDVGRDRRTDTTTTEVTRPDGTKEKTTHTVTESETNKTVDRTTAEERDRVAETHKEVIQEGSKVTVSALFGAQFSSLSLSQPLVYGASLTRPILGPVTIGVFGMSNMTFGASIGFTF